MRTVFPGLALCVTCFAKPTPDLEVVAPEVIFKNVVDQYAGPPDDVCRYLTAMPTVAARYFGPALELCLPRANPSGLANGARLVWTSTSTVAFESGRSSRLPLQRKK
jgi:hypothetical protein